VSTGFSGLGSGTTVQAWLPGNWGRHLPSVGSQNSPPSQSIESTQAPPGAAQLPATHTDPAPQHRSLLSPQRTPLAQAGLQDPSMHSLPTAQHSP
jgi:hypothetical protein